jgi:hypothetical protein
MSETTYRGYERAMFTKILTISIKRKGVIVIETCPYSQLALQVLKPWIQVSTERKTGGILTILVKFALLPVRSTLIAT